MSEALVARPRPAVVLLTELETDRAQAAQTLLAEHGYGCSLVTTLADSKQAIAQAQPDVVLLDLDMEDGTGLTRLPHLCRSTAAFVLGFGRRQRDCIIALRLGAAMWLGYPWDAEEFVARVEVLLRSRRRPPVVNDDVRRVGLLRMDRRRAQVKVGDVTVGLTPTEYRIMDYLTSHPDQILTRDELCTELWGSADAATSHVLDVNLYRIRQKLRRAQPTNPLISTVYGHGVCLNTVTAMCS